MLESAQHRWDVYGRAFGLKLVKKTLRYTSVRGLNAYFIRR
jgi:hypothetical protein